MCGLLCLTGAVVFLVTACNRTAQRSEAALTEVVVYTSVDQQFAQTLLAQFARESGVEVKPVYDTEAGKTTGLVRRLYQERGAPRCDVWWSSEVFGTIELARAGVLAAYKSPSAADIPPEWKDKQDLWTGLAPRARVLAYRPAAVRPASLPKSWQALAAAPAERSTRFALANPQFGTTRGHVAAQFAFWGDKDGALWLQNLRDTGVQLADGNAHAVRMLEAGQADWCMTDTDDVWAAQRRGAAIELTYPKLDADQPILWIPCTVALVAGGPNTMPGRKLVDFLVSAAAERALAESDSHNVPVRPGLLVEMREGGGRYFTQTPVAIDYERVANAMPGAMSAAREILLR